MKKYLLLTILLLGIGCNKNEDDFELLTQNMFYSKLGPAPIEGAFYSKDYIIWGGSVIKANDDRYYMFASRWPNALGMSRWVTNSEVVLASSATPEGPFQFEMVVLPSRGADFWDGMVTHNPTIRYYNGKYILFYTGTTYSFKKPDVKDIPDRKQYETAWNKKRIGIAIADNVHGPWQRFDKPILEPRPGEWDGAITSNPAPVILDDGSVMLYYKSAPVPYPQRNQNPAMHFGAARADHYTGPYKRIKANNQIELKNISSHVEDPYIWYANEVYHMIAKSMDEKITGEKYSGFYMWSKDGLTWELTKHPKAYSRKVLFSDGTIKNLKKLERPQVLLSAGRPTHIYFAADDPEKGHIYNLVIPVIQ